MIISTHNLLNLQPYIRAQTNILSWTTSTSVHHSITISKCGEVLIYKNSALQKSQACLLLINLQLEEWCWEISCSSSYTFPSDEGRIVSAFTAVEDDVDTAFVPLEGAEEGEGSFLGSICWKEEALGHNLDASADDDEERTMKAITRTRVKRKLLCLKEADILMMEYRLHMRWVQRPEFNFERCDISISFREFYFILFLQQTCWVMYGECQLVCLRKAVSMADNGVLYNSKNLLEQLMLLPSFV